MCNCNECLEHVDCDCPSTSGIAGIQIQSVTEAVYTPEQPINGAGFDVVLYTNSSGATQTVVVETNIYVIADATHVLTSTYKRATVALTGTGVALKENAPTKTDHTHYLPATTLTNGQNISITIQSSHATGRLAWIKSVIYKY